MDGLIVKSLGGFYYVECRQGVIQTRARGIFRKEGISPVVGDRVEIDVFSGDDGEGVLNHIKERKNHFDRPPVANVDVMLVIFSAVSPEPNYDVIDKFLIMAESKGCDAIICVNKMDLVGDRDITAIMRRYDHSYDIHAVSCMNKTGIDGLKEKIKDRTVALAGPSGVGKSTLARIMIPEVDIETGDVSRKTGRGRHTTRHVELFHIPGGGMLFDTPGFTSLDLEDIEPEDLDELYPELVPFRDECRFGDCLHMNEPDCAVKDAVEQGKIRPERYDSYSANLTELMEKRRF